jgi:hypothetical protein
VRRDGPQWLDDDAGPIVRPYALTQGRVRSSGDEFDLIALVTVNQSRVVDESLLGPEQVRILAMSGQAISVADIASDVDLPLGVVRVLLGDLHDQGLISVRPPAQVAPLPSARILKEVINGLRAL